MPEISRSTLNTQHSTLKLACAGKVLDLSRPQIMGILNITPDSFSDGGDFFSAQKAIEHAQQMVTEGAAVIDIGGESTRPGAQPVTASEEIDRVVPVIEALRDLAVPISIDTSKPEVMRAAVKAGAGMINDVCALRSDGALDAAAELKVPVCLMHMQGEPRGMQQHPQYDNVVEDIKQFLLERADKCEQAGIARNQIIIDPGFGFGKTLQHNLSLLRHLDEFVASGLPVLAGISRKSMLGTILDAEPGQRVFGSVAAAVIAAMKGAIILRVHDVAATRQALEVCQAALEAQ